MQELKMQKNILIDSVPSTFMIGGTEYPIHTDFRTWIRFELLLQSDVSTETDILEQAKELIFIESIPPEDYNDDTVAQMVLFYCCGQTEIKAAGKSAADAQQIYDYNIDAAYIYAAFMQQYNIDLHKIKSLHWWLYQALFTSLSEECKFVKIMEYRSVKITAKMPQEQRDFYRRMQRIYGLSQPKAKSKKIDQINARLMRGEDVADLL